MTDKLDRLQKLPLSAPRRSLRDPKAPLTPVWGWVLFSLAILIGSIALSRLLPGAPLGALEQAVELERAPGIDAR